MLILFLILFSISCEEPKEFYGCTDPEACNFNPEANIFDNSCLYNNDCFGCTDSNYDNYNQNATIDDGSCYNLEFITIPAGDYTYGSNDEVRNISYDFDIMKYEVTNEQYAVYLTEALNNGDITAYNYTVEGYYGGDTEWSAGIYEYLDLDDSDCEITYSGGQFTVDSGKENHPVIEVTWFGANAFAEHYGFRLPTEEEWEKSARGNTGSNYPWGDNSPTCQLANYYNCVGWTQPIGEATGTSPYGLYDMAGNVREWTQSWYSETSSSRVNRGGSWNGSTSYCLSWVRSSYNPTGNINSIGFRVARTQ